MLTYSISINTMENSAVTCILLLSRVAVWCFKIKRQVLAPENPNSNYDMHVCMRVCKKELELLMS